MKMEGEFVFNGSREDVWNLLRDPEILATALPGTQSLNKISDTEYTGKMNLRIGPISGSFAGKILVSDEVPPESYTLSVEGRGAPGHGKGTGSVELLDQGDGTTLMKYSGDLSVGGKLAGVGQRLLDSVSKSMTRQGLESLNRKLQTNTTPESGGDHRPEYTPPSETQMAINVAKDLADDLFSPENQAVWTAVAIALISVTLGFVLGRISRGSS